MTLDRLESYFRSARSLAARPGIRRLFWLLAAVLFIAASAIAYARLPSDLSIDPVLLVVALATVPIVVGLTAVEVDLLGHLAGVEIGLRAGLRITVAGAAANLAPAPGSLAVRVGAIVSRGGRLGKATAANLAVGLIWLGVALIIGACAVAAGSSSTWSLLVAASGIVVTGMAVVIAFRQSPSWALSLKLLALEASIVLVSSLRTFVVFAALGLDGTFAQAIGVTVSQVIATATGFFPAGLGLSELLAGLTAPLTGAVASVVVVVAVADRLVRMLGLAIMAPLVRTRQSDPPVQTENLSDGT